MLKLEIRRNQTANERLIILFIFKNLITISFIWSHNNNSQTKTMYATKIWNAIRSILN